MDEHSANVVIILQSKLANTSMGFKEALELRSEVRNSRPAISQKLFFFLTLFLFKRIWLLTPRLFWIFDDVK